jgi:hypothetical protein
MKVTWIVIEILKKAGFFPDSPRKRHCIVVTTYRNLERAKCRVELQNGLE